MKTSLLILMAASIMTSILGAEPLNQGDKTPESIPALAQDGTQFDLGKEMQQGVTFVFFYPKALTGGCTKQACSVRDIHAELAEMGVKVYGVSLDNEELQTKFKETHNLPYTLIADKESKSVVKAFGVPHMGVAKRQAFLVKDGEVIWADHKASTGKQAEDLMAALEEAGIAKSDA